jgi:hypothetical protein
MGDDRGSPDILEAGRIEEPDEAGLMGQNLPEPVQFILRAEWVGCRAIGDALRQVLESCAKAVEAIV